MPLPTTIDPKSLVAGIDRTLAARSIGDGGNTQYLRLGKAGQFIYGSEDTPVEEDAHWAINPASFQAGFTAWGQGELLGESMNSVSDAPISLAELPDVGAPWKPAAAFQLACISGEDKGVELLFKTSSKGGNRAADAVLVEVVKRARAGSVELVPIVELAVTNYKHKEFGKIFVPVFEIVKWVSFDTEAEPEPEPEDEPEPKAKATGGKKKAEPEPETEPEERQPRRRRRRAA